MEEPTHDDDDEEQDSYDPYYMEPPDHDDNARNQNTRDPYSNPDNGRYVWSYTIEEEIQDMLNEPWPINDYVSDPIEVVSDPMVHVPNNVVSDSLVVPDPQDTFVPDNVMSNHVDETLDVSVPIVKREKESSF